MLEAILLWPGLWPLDANLRWIEQMAPIAVAYSAGFTLYTLFRIAAKTLSGVERVRDSAFLSEVNAAPITGMISYLFVVAVLNVSVHMVAMTLWWSVGFWASVYAVVSTARRGKRVNWIPVRVPISWACKLCYLWMMWVFYVFEMPVCMFAFSIWIMIDQVGRLFTMLDADRTRRTFDDAWLFRLLYPLGLFLPMTSEMPYRAPFAAFGAFVFALWVLGLVYVVRAGQLLKLPAEAATLRNMMYFDTLDTLEVESEASKKPSD